MLPSPSTSPEVNAICAPVIAEVGKLLAYLRELERAAERADIVVRCDVRGCERLVPRDRICEVLNCTEQPSACITCAPEEYGTCKVCAKQFCDGHGHAGSSECFGCQYK